MKNIIGLLKPIMLDPDQVPFLRLVTSKTSHQEEDPLVKKVCLGLDKMINHLIILDQMPYNKIYKPTRQVL